MKSESTQNYFEIGSELIQNCFKIDVRVEIRSELIQNWFDTASGLFRY